MIAKCNNFISSPKVFLICAVIHDTGIGHVMRKLNGITINGEYLGNGVVINGMFRAICTISPVIMRDFIQIINNIEKLEDAVKIYNFNCGFDNINIEFENMTSKGIASLYFKLKNGIPELTDYKLLIDNQEYSTFNGTKQIPQKSVSEMTNPNQPVGQPEPETSRQKKIGELREQKRLKQEKLKELQQQKQAELKKQRLTEQEKKRTLRKENALLSPESDNAAELQNEIVNSDATESQESQLDQVVQGSRAETNYSKNSNEIQGSADINRISELEQSTDKYWEPASNINVNENDMSELEKEEFTDAEEEELRMLENENLELDSALEEEFASDVYDDYDEQSYDRYDAQESSNALTPNAAENYQESQYSLTQHLQDTYNMYSDMAKNLNEGLSQGLIQGFQELSNGLCQGLSEGLSMGLSQGLSNMSSNNANYGYNPNASNDYQAQNYSQQAYQYDNYQNQQYDYGYDSAYNNDFYSQNNSGYGADMNEVANIANQYQNASANANQNQNANVNDNPQQQPLPVIMPPKQNQPVTSEVDALKAELEALKAAAKKPPKKELMTLDEFLAKQRELAEEKERRRRQKFRIMGSNVRINASALQNGVFVAGNKVYKWGDTRVLDE